MTTALQRTRRQPPALKVGARQLGAALAARLLRVVEEERLVRAVVQMRERAAVKAASPKYGCLMAMVPQALASKIVDWSKNNINPEDLYDEI